MDYTYSLADGQIRHFSHIELTSNHRCPKCDKLCLRVEIKIKEWEKGWLCSNNVHHYLCDDSGNLYRAAYYMGGHTYMSPLAANPL